MNECCLIRYSAAYVLAQRYAEWEFFDFAGVPASSIRWFWVEGFRGILMKLEAVVGNKMLTLNKMLPREVL